MQDTRLHRDFDPALPRSVLCLFGRSYIRFAASVTLCRVAGRTQRALLIPTDRNALRMGVVRPLTRPRRPSAPHSGQDVGLCENRRNRFISGVLVADKVDAEMS